LLPQIVRSIAGSVSVQQHGGRPTSATRLQEWAKYFNQRE